MRRLLILSVVISVLATACGSGGSSVLGASSWCDAAKKIDDTSNEMDGADIPTAEMFNTFADQLNGAVASAPAEIKDDVKLLGSVMNDMAKALKDNSDNIILAFDAMGDKLNDPAVGQAGDRITAYNERECGIVDTNSSDTNADSSGNNGFDSSGDSGFGSPGNNGFDSSGNNSGFDPSGGSGDGTFDAGIVAGLAQSLGITEDQARCVVTSIDFTSGTEPDLASMMSSFADCGVDPLSLGGG